MGNIYTRFSLEERTMIHTQLEMGLKVERTTLFTVLSRMDNASAEAALSGFSHVLNRIEAHRRLSLTYDQGREMTAHQRLTEAIGVTVYFSDPHSPWQRGINENTNGLLRQYLPKGSDLSGFTQEELAAIAWTEHPTTQVAGLQVSRGVVHPGRIRFQAASCCAFCTWSLKPPTY